MVSARLTTSASSGFFTVLEEERPIAPGLRDACGPDLVDFKDYDVQ